MRAIAALAGKRMKEKTMENTLPLISIVIPCYNYAHFLPEAIESVLSQSYQNLECIIVNDGSTDTTEEVAGKYAGTDSRIQYVRQDNQGLAAARNTGIARAAGKYILPLDADDKIAAEYARRALAVLEENPNIGIVYCDARFFGSTDKRFDLPPYSFPEILLFNRIFATAFFRKEDWAACGGYNEQMKDGLEDYDFWLSIIEMGRDIHKIPEVLFYYRQGHVSMTKKTYSMRAKLYARVARNHASLYFDNAEFLFQTLERLQDENARLTMTIDEIKRSFLYRHIFKYFLQAEEAIKEKFFR